MALNNSTGPFEALFAVSTANVGLTKEETKDFKVDVISLYNEKEMGVPHLKFPSDIATNDIKKNKSLSLYILKDIAYQQMIDAGKAGLAGAEKSVIENKGTSMFGEALNIYKPDGTQKSTWESTKEVVNALGTLSAAGGQAVVAGLKSAGQALAGSAKLNTDNIDSSQYHCAITLPIPNNLTEDDSHSYEESTGLGEELKSVLPKSITEGVEAIYGKGQTIGQIGLQMAAGKDRRRSQQIAQLPILNPYTWKKFKGSALKVFRFTFFFIPRSKEEAETIMQIVYTLKKYSYGSRAPSELTSSVAQQMGETGQDAISAISDATISAPPKILLKFSNPMLQKLLNPGVCVIESIGLTYNEGNTVGMTLDGVPRFIEMNLNLTEHNVRFQEDF